MTGWAGFIMGWVLFFFFFGGGLEGGPGQILEHPSVSGSKL